MRNRLLSFPVAVIAIIGVGLSAVADPVPKIKAKTTQEKLVGKWNLVKQKGTEINDIWVEFEKDGKMKLHFGQGMGNVTYKGKYKADKDVIEYEIDMDGMVTGEKLKIITLTDDRLKTEDEDKIEEEFERATVKKDAVKKDDKKDEKKKPN